MVSAELLAQSIPASTDPVAGPSGVAIHMSASRKFPAKRAWSRAFYPHLTDPGIMALCRLVVTKGRKFLWLSGRNQCNIFDVLKNSQIERGCGKGVSEIQA
jgi:hypothetical protein